MKSPTAILAALAVLLATGMSPDVRSQDSTQSQQNTQQQAGTELSPEVKNLQSSIRKMEAQCQDDVKKLCKDQSQDVASCLYERRDEVDQSCKDSIAQADDAATKVVDKADVEFRKACGQDVQRYCADVPQGGGRILECLAQEQEGLSNSCKSFQAKVKQQIESFSRSS